MAAAEREARFEVEPGVCVRYRRSEAPPPYTYAITLEVEDGEDVWRTVRLWDNADDPHQHHMHIYTRTEGKLRPAILPFASSNQAMAAAMAEARGRTAEIVRQWRSS